MRTFLARRWFLLLLLTGITLALGWPDGLRPFTVHVPVRLIVPALLFLMAWGLESGRLVQAVLRPFPALWAVVISYGFVPAVAWAVGHFLEPDYGVGLLISASAPCTLASAVLWTRMAGGDEATALLVTFLSTCTSWFFTTLWLTLGSGTTVAVDTLAMMQELALVLVLPVAAGQFLRLSRPLARLATEGKTVFGIISRLCILSVILKAAVDIATRIGEQTTAVAVLPLVLAMGVTVGVHFLGLLAGLGSGALLRFERPVRIAVAFAGSQKTLPVALFLFEAYFRESYPLAVVSLVTYHVGQLIVDTFVADYLARGRTGA